MRKEITQCDRVYDYLKRHNTITPLQAWEDIGVYRLSARISDLKNRYGCIISKEMVTVYNRFGEKCKVARYRLVG